jgi:hypothetical protein
MIEVGSSYFPLSSAIYHLPSPLPIGGLLSVALSLALRLVGVTHHPVLRRPDFPPALDIRVNGARAGGRPVLLGETSKSSKKLDALLCRRVGDVHQGSVAACSDHAGRVASACRIEGCSRSLRAKATGFAAGAI